MGTWHTWEGTVGMPLLAPGGKLSEVELLKLLNAEQWASISRLFGVPTHRICNDAGERLYASVLHVELSFGPAHSPDRFGEGARLVVRNLVRTFAQRFVEGLFVFDDAEVPDADLAAITTREALRAQPRPWAYMVNTFVTRPGGNASLMVFKPAGIAAEAEPLGAPPPGIDDHGRVQRTGEIPPFDGHREGISPPASSRAVSYRIVPESDLNGAGLLYFARYAAITSYAERVFAERRLAPPLSNALIEALSTQHRRLYYFANAASKDVVDVTTEATVIPVDAAAAPAGAAGLPVRTPLEVLFRMDLHRRSDRTLMASSLVRKALNVPAASKAVLVEAHRFLHRLRS